MVTSKYSHEIYLKMTITVEKSSGKKSRDHSGDDVYTVNINTAFMLKFNSIQFKCDYFT